MLFNWYDALSLWAMVVILCAAPFLTLWRNCDTGLIGTMLLCGMSCGAFVALGESVFDGKVHQVPPSITLLLCSVAGFMLRYIWVRWWLVWRGGPQRRRLDRA